MLSLNTFVNCSRRIVMVSVIKSRCHVDYIGVVIANCEVKLLNGGTVLPRLYAVFGRKIFWAIFRVQEGDRVQSGIPNVGLIIIIICLK